MAWKKKSNYIDAPLLLFFPYCYSAIMASFPNHIITVKGDESVYITTHYYYHYYY